MAFSTVSYTADGSTKQFLMTWDYLDEDHITVEVDYVLTTEVGSNYQFSVINSTTLEVTQLDGSAVESGKLVTLKRDTPISTRPVSFTEGSALRASDLNTNSDFLLYAMQEAIDEVEGVNDEAIQVRADVLAAQATTEAARDAAAVSAANAATSETNLSTAEANTSASAAAAATSETNAAGSATTASTAATNASTSETNAANSASAASTSETNAATSETNAAASATTATTAATNASTSETNAATSETNAATSAAAAAASQTAAANSAAAAAAAYDSFDDRYLGALASDPTVNNDGDPLITGNLYFNNTVSEMRVYDGGNWIPASSAGTASMLIYEYTATGGQTTFSGTDDNAATMSYSQNNVIVTLNGIVLQDTVDYTATDGLSVVLTSGAAASDLLVVTAFKSFTTADMVPASTGGAFSGNISAPKYSGSGEKIKTDIFRINEQTLNTDVTIDADENASCAGPLTVASGVTLTVTTGGNLVIS